jgi:parvulin-like peptidyl-prolyl isomerase
VKKRVMASILVLGLAVVVGLLAGCGGTSDLPGDVVVQVGGTDITQAQLDERTAVFEQQYAGQTPSKEDDPDGYKEFQLRVLDYMVMYEMGLQKAASLNLEVPDVTVTDADVQAEIDTILNDYYGGDQAQFDEALAAQNMTLDELKSAYQASMRYEKEGAFLQSVYDEVTKDITTVPDEELAAYYEEHKADYFVDETRTVRHILISPEAEASDDSSTTSTTVSSDAGDTTSTESTTTTAAEPTQADWDAALATAEEVRTELVDGGDWTVIAAEYSDDPGTKDSGGDLGVVSRGEMVTEFEDSVFSLSLNEISQPVKTIYGYHVIQVTGINEAKQQTLDEVKEDISSVLLNEKKAALWEQWLTETKAELGVVYKEGMELVTTTLSTATSSGQGDTDSTAEGQTITTAAPATTTTEP